MRIVRSRPLRFRRSALLADPSSQGSNSDIDVMVQERVHSCLDGSSVAVLQSFANLLKRVQANSVGRVSLLGNWCRDGGRYGNHDLCEGAVVPSTTGLCKSGAETTTCNTSPVVDCQSSVARALFVAWSRVPPCQVLAQIGVQEPAASGRRFPLDASGCIARPMEPVKPLSFFFWQGRLE